MESRQLRRAYKSLRKKRKRTAEATEFLVSLMEKKQAEEKRGKCKLIFYNVPDI